MMDEARLKEIRKRSEERKSRITVKKVSLHDETQSSSFHPEYDTISAWDHLMSISRLEYQRKTGKEAPNRVDKSKVKIVTKEERYKNYENLLD